MKSAVVVERHPVHHLVHGLPAGFEFPAVQATHFQASPEALRGRVIPAVALAAHRAFHLVARQRRLEFVATVLAATVRVKDHARLW